MNNESINDNNIEYIAYPKAIQMLSSRINATSEDLAVWILFEHNGMKAFLKTNELTPPQEFSYAMLNGASDPDYIKPLMACCFDLKIIESYTPTEQYITGKNLIIRWSNYPMIDPITYITIKIQESKLQDIHPVFGLTQASVDDDSFPSIEEGLFAMSEIESIEIQDFEFEESKKVKDGLLNFNPKFQAMANEFANKYYSEYKRFPTKYVVAKKLALNLKVSVENCSKEN
jgi:hypothetical protein